MSITTADGWFAAAKQAILIQKTVALTTVAAQPFSMWAATGQPGAGTLALSNTTSGILFDDTYAGAPSVNSFGGGATGYLSMAQFRNSVTGAAMLYDRLWGAGAVSMTTLATTNFSGQPSYTGRIPGGTDYGNLEILLEITTTVSATATTVSVGYTNSVGTTGQSTGASASLSGIITPQIIRLPLQAGDQGVQQITSVTVGGTVATSGAFNVIVARRLATFDARVANGSDLQGWDVIGSPVVYATSCFWLVCQPDSTSSGTPTCYFNVING